MKEKDGESSFCATLVNVCVCYINRRCCASFPDFDDDGKLEDFYTACVRLYRSEGIY